MLILITINLNGQVWISQGAEWHYIFSTVAGTGGFIRINYTGDTLVNSQTCQKLVETTYTFGADQFGNTYLISINSNPPNLTYSSGDTVFYYVNNKFEVLYNFGAQPNDSWYMGKYIDFLNCDSSAYTQVDSIGNITINSQNLRWVSLNPSDTSSYGLYGIANERFGNMANYLFPQPQNCDTNIIAEFTWITFLCYQDNSFALYNVTTNDCEYLLSVNGINFKRTPTIYPNPTSGLINILNAKVTQVEIFNISGKLIKFNLNKNSIDISTQCDGIYFIKVVTDKGVMNRKIIKKSN